MDIKKTFKNLLTDTSALVGEGYNQAAALMKETFGNFSDVKNITKEKLSGLTNDVLLLIPIIEQTGFRTKEVEVGISVPPRIIFHFEKFSDVSKDAIEKILEENADKTLLRIIVNTLISADQFQQSLTLGNLKFTEIAIEMGIPPEVNVKLVNTNTAS
jgi:hypothetical protein